MNGGVTTVLTPCPPGLAAMVSSWAPTVAEVSAWCSRADAPVPPDVIVGWGARSDVRAYVLRTAADMPIAYGELWIDDDEHEVEIARVLVDPAHRGGGVGRALTSALVAAAREHHDAVFLRVEPGNDAALACYRAAGFTRVPPADEAAWNHGQPRDYVWLTHGGS